MRIEYGFIVSGKKRYAYMTEVYLCNIMICDYDGEPTIYAELEATVPNVFDMILEQARAKGYEVVIERDAQGCISDVVKEHIDIRKERIENERLSKG